MLVIGDVHGKIDKFWKITQNEERTIQLGDFGFKKEHDWHLDNKDSEKNKIVFGNHDYYPYLNQPHSTGNYSMIEYEGQKIFCIRGAASIDKHMRLEGRDWWRNEEIRYGEFVEVAEAYSKYKPDIVISHDCPTSVKHPLFNYKPRFGGDKPSMTNEGLESCFDMWQPELWLFGHHHISKDEVINSTRFICLAELETYKL